MKDDKLFNEAIDWLLRMEDSSREDRRAFRKWLFTSPRHVLACLRAKLHLGTMRKTIHDLRLDEKTVRPIYVQPVKREQPALRLAASLAALGVMIATILFVSNGSVRTDAGEWRTQTLTDGTVVEMGPRTKLVVKFTDEQRIVHLDRGEAFFRVAPNHSRPFFVVTDPATARAVGTAFAVSRVYENMVLVTVEEGTVAVTRPAHSSSSPDESVMVHANQQVRVTQGSALRAERVNAHEALAWVRRTFVFAMQTRVADAVREFNLRNHVQIEIAGESSLATKRVSGGFRADDPNAFVAFLERKQVASVVRDDSDTLRLVPYDESNK